MLTFHQLKTIREGHARNEDILTLLREIHRLRNLAVLTYSTLSAMPLNGLGENLPKLKPVFEALRQEPAVQGYMRAQEKRSGLHFPQASEGRDGDMGYYLRQGERNVRTSQTSRRSY